MPRADDIRQLELRTTHNGPHFSQRLVFKDTGLDVGNEVYGLHNRVCATGYQVKVKVQSITEIQKLGYPMYAVVLHLPEGQVVIEELRTDPKDPPEGQGKRAQMDRAFFLEHYEVD